MTMTRRQLSAGTWTCLASAAAMTALSSQGWAGRLENPVAVFAALDKVTARISKLEVPVNETVEFGSLRVTPRVCYTRSPTEPPKTTTYVDVQEIDLDGSETKLFSGWMFAESPGLNAVEHPVFDVWLTACKGGQSQDSQPAQADTEQPLRRRRVRR